MDQNVEESEVEFDVEDFTRWNMSRRSLLRSGVMAGGALAAGGLLAACKGGGASGSGATGSTGSSGTSGSTSGSSGTSKGGSTGGGKMSTIVPVPRKDVVLAEQTLTVYDSFNPFIPNGWNYDNGAQQILCEFPIYLNFATGKLIYWQATGWKYNSDYTECTLKLRDGVKWSDGKPLTSADAVWTVELNMKHAAAIGSTYGTQIKSVSAPDDLTVKFELSAVNPRFHYNFIAQIISSAIWFAPKHVWEKENFQTYKANPPIFTGPYTLKESNQNQGYVLWEKNPDYWAKSMMDPAPQYVAWRNTPTSQDLVNESFKQGEIDCSGTTLQYAQSLQKQGDNWVEITNFPDPEPRTMIFNCDPSRGALSDPKFRWAMSCLIDRQKVIENIWPVPTVAAIFPWANYAQLKKWETESVAKPYMKYLEYNPTLAGQLLDEIGITKSGSTRHYQGKPLNLQIITPVESTGQEYQVGELLVGELKSIGISANLKYLAGSVFTNTYNQGKFDICSEWYGGVPLDPYQLWYDFNDQYNMPIGGNQIQGSDQMRWKSPEMDKIIKEMALLAPDDPKSLDLSNQALELYFANLPVLCYLQTVYSHITSKQYWTNWPTQGNMYQGPSNWWGQFLFIIGALKPA